ncbi:MAG: hypothetical protein KC584_09370, partial [Nitrospira sp.]|nr:hypothetical protein [Nitrospira sp.]
FSYPQNFFKDVDKTAMTSDISMPSLRIHGIQNTSKTESKSSSDSGTPQVGMRKNEGFESSDESR